MSTPTSRRGPSLVAALVLAAGLGLGASPALAQESPSPTPTATATATQEAPAIDVDRVGSLVVTAIANDEAKRHAVEGVVFEVRHWADVDLGDAADLQAALDLAAGGEVPEGWSSQSLAVLEATDATGRTWLPELGVGLYSIEQVVADGEEATYLPMHFTMPSMHPVDGVWTYDLRIYPKPVPEDCDCEEPTEEPTASPSPSPSPTERPTAAPTPGPTDPGKPAPRPGVPTGEMIQENAHWGLLGLAGALVLGAGSVALRRKEKDGSTDA